MSIVLGDTLAALERRPEDLPDETPWADDEWGVAVLEAGYVANEEEQEILRTPNGDERAHGDVRGEKKRARRKHLKRRAEWVVPPAAPPPVA